MLLRILDMNNSRTFNSIKNVSVVIISKLLQIFLTFITRTLLIRKIGIEILGLDGLFTSILSVLSLAELGLGSAIIFSFYEPLIKNQEKKIAAYITFFRKVYALIGIAITLIGVSLLPVLPLLINLPSDVNNLNLIYVLTVMGTSVSYFFSSKRIIFEADQRKYKVTVIDAICNAYMQIAQILLIIWFQDYIMVLVNRIVFVILSNVIIEKAGNSQYSYLKQGKHCKLENKEIKKLFVNTGCVLCHNIGGVLVTGTDSMIISAIISTIVSGIYSNYVLIINSVTTFITIAINSIIPSVGNLKAESASVEHHYSVYEMVLLVNYIASSFCTSMLFCLLNPFIEIWLGKQYLLSVNVVIVLCINFYISTMRYGIGAFCTAGGYFKETILKPILEAIINIVTSIWLAKEIGLIGVFIGTFLSLVLGSVWIDPYVLYKRWFMKSFKTHIVIYMKMLLSTVVFTGILYFVSENIKIENSYGELAVKCGVVGIGAVLFIFITTLKLPGRNMLVKKIKAIFKIDV